LSTSYNEIALEIGTLEEIDSANTCKVKRIRYDEATEGYAGVVELADTLDSKSKKGKSQKQGQKPQTDSR